MIIRLEKELKEFKDRLEFLQETSNALNSMIEDIEKAIEYKVHGYYGRPVSSDLQHIEEVKELIVNRNALSIYRVELTEQLCELDERIELWEQAIESRRKLIELKNQEQDYEQD